MSRLVTLGIVLVAVLAASVWIVRRCVLAIRRHMHDGGPHPPRRRRCGYDLTRLPAPRCPECGALAGFNRSCEEMGIEEHELDF